MADFTNINGVNVKDGKAREDLQVLSDYVDTIIPIGRTETVLWQYDPNTMQPGQNITLSDKLSNYDEVCFIPYYVPDGTTTRTGNSCYFGSQFIGASDSDRKYVSVTGVTVGAAEYCDFKYDGNVTLYFSSLSTYNALWVYSIIGIKY